ncbi:hypothetical protein Scep_030647 [Stephania cephalantha]|uniref:Uncharacterized protein n=1 Tax=Stephania cephalantha TaxID=152367 RepID=A0AAP0E061_9MAGN
MLIGIGVTHLKFKPIYMHIKLITSLFHHALDRALNGQVFKWYNLTSTVNGMGTLTQLLGIVEQQHTHTS